MSEIRVHQRYELLTKSFLIFYISIKFERKFLLIISKSLDIHLKPTMRWRHHRGPSSFSVINTIANENSWTVFKNETSVIYYGLRTRVEQSASWNAQERCVDWVYRSSLNREVVGVAWLVNYSADLRYQLVGSHMYACVHVLEFSVVKSLAHTWFFWESLCVLHRWIPYNWERDFDGLP